MRYSGLVSAVLVLGLIAGCCANSDSGKCAGKEIIAKINGYELTSEDFLAEVKLISPKMYDVANTQRAKEDALEQLITKKILLQEAQKANFDKDKKFMEEIERYWEQALLKLLMKKKIDEFSKNISLEIPFETRQQMLQKEIGKWVADVRKTAKIKIYKENLNKLEIKSPSLQEME